MKKISLISCLLADRPMFSGWLDPRPSAASYDMQGKENKNYRFKKDLYSFFPLQTEIYKGLCKGSFTLFLLSIKLIFNSARPMHAGNEHKVSRCVWVASFSHLIMEVSVYS